MKEISFRTWWDNFKVGYGEGQYPIGVVQLGLSGATLLYHIFNGTSRRDVLVFLLIVGVIGCEFLERIGHWQRKSKRSFWKKSIERDVHNNPYTQAQLRFFIAIGKKMEIDATELMEWLSN